MKYDELYQFIGHMGRFQWIIFSVMFAVAMFCMEGLNMIFVGADMDHWCLIEPLSDLPPEKQKYVGIPGEKFDDETDDVIKYSSCEMFDVNWTLFTFDELVNWNRSQWLINKENGTVAVKKCAAWNYDRSVFTSTIISRVRTE